MIIRAFSISPYISALNSNIITAAPFVWAPWVRTVSNFNDRIQLHLICQMLILAKFSGVESERTISMFRKKKRKFLFCAPVLNEEVHIAVMRRRLENV